MMWHIKYLELHEERIVWMIRGDFARGQRTRPIALESEIIPIGSFGDVNR
jgi:hypothetical protein